MKRIFLICVILVLCVIVAVCGNIALVNGSSVLKNKSEVKSQKDTFRLFVDLVENRLSFIKNEKILKSYPISQRLKDMPSPVGTWKITKKEKKTKGSISYLIGLNIPWGKYSIYGTDGTEENNRLESSAFVFMFNDDARDLFNIAPLGTEVEIYDGPMGPFGKELRVIKPRDRGADVFEIQSMLKEQGFLKGEVNGIYDSKMKIAVHNFEKVKRLRIEDDINLEFIQRLGIILME